MPWVPPTFWQNDNIWARMLQPASMLYGRIQKTLYQNASPYRSSLPVICIGNVQLGGSGKTPVTQALYHLILQSGTAQNPVILLRGYGGSLKGPSAVDIARHSAAEVGDEALLHAHYAPTIIAHNRAEGARLAELAGHDLILMDDGLQNNQLEKTLSFLVFNTDQGLGNERVFPAGPLRETLGDALDKVAGIFCLGDQPPFDTNLPGYHCRINAPMAADPHASYIAFCGIAQPEKFLKTLKESHYNIVDFVPFADHHPYSDADLAALDDRAAMHAARLITTEKDAMRLPAAWQDKAEVLKISYVISDPDRLVDQIARAIAP